MSFFLKSRRLQLNQERTSSKVLSHEIWEISENSLFLEQLLVNASVSGVALVEPYQNRKYLTHQTNSHHLQVVRAILYFVKQFSRKKTWNIRPINVHDGVPLRQSNKLKLLKQGSDIFLEHFNFFFQNSHSVDLMRITSSDIQIFP